jgi:antagonist of KipI
VKPNDRGLTPDAPNRGLTPDLQNRVELGTDLASRLVVVKPGMLTTVQDLGRVGYQGLGVPVSGPMDAYSHRLANQLLGNDPMAAALEITLLGPELVAEGDVTCAIAGAEIEVTVDGASVPRHEPFRVTSGSRLRWGARGRGTRMTLAVRGGFDVPLTLGSRAMHLVSRMGPFGGRSLRAGDVLPVAPTASSGTANRGTPLDLPEGGAQVRVVPAAHRERFTSDAWELLIRTRFVVSPQSNRMGYRLDGPPLGHAAAADILSEAMPIGAMQVPASGQAILLMAERQTTGGYATIANVITADLPIAGQLAPGDWIAFLPVTHAEAIAALRERESALAGVGR